MGPLELPAGIPWPLRVHLCRLRPLPLPENARLLTSTYFASSASWSSAFAREHIDGVISNNEYFGAFIAAVGRGKARAARQDPRVVLTAQHQFYARAAMARVASEASPRYAAFPYTVSGAGLSVRVSLLSEAVKATFSVLARRIDNLAELRRHLSFWPFEKLVIKRLVKPFTTCCPGTPISASTA